MLYNLYKTDGTIPYGITDWEHLRVMRLDLTERQLYNYRYIEDNPDTMGFRYNPERDLNAPLKKIGFLGRDFNECRPGGQLSENFFSYLKKYQDSDYHDFEVYFYCLNINHVDKNFKEFAIVKQKNTMGLLAKEIYDDEIDILIDMQGYMIDNFKEVLLKKPAPIQMHWLGYPGTLGISTVDYLVADETIIPDSSQKYYREKIAYLPDCYQSNSPRFIQKEQWVNRKYFDIPEDAFVFTNFNSDYKVDRKIWFVWMDILKAVPNSVLVFTILTSKEEDIFISQLFDDVVKKGVDIKRVIYLQREKRHQHFNRLQLFDLGLDTFRINGHTTSADLICAGLPFVTYTSATYHNRVGASILKSLDLEELVCHSYDEYSKKIIELATNKKYYQEVKRKVIDNREKILFNPGRYTRNFVDLIYSIWNKYSNLKTHELTHFYPEEHNEWKKTSIQNIKLGDFNNHYYGTKTHEWKFYPNKKYSGHVFEISEKRNQYLKDYANSIKECVAFSMEGELMNTYGELIEIKGETELNTESSSLFNGVWVLEKLDDDEPDVNDTLNKDYQLPKICLYYFLENEDDPTIVSRLVTYLFTQLYLNAELLIITKNFYLNQQAQNFIRNHNHFIYFHNDNINESLDTIFNYYTNTVFRVQITDDILEDYHYVEKLYEETIKPNNFIINKK